MARVGDVIDAENARWRFGGETSAHYDAHVARSVPQYAACQDLVASLSDFFLPSGAHCCDLGCGTGTLTAKLAARHAGRDVTFTGIDAEPDMIARARERHANAEGVRFEQADLTDTTLEPCDLAVAFYTLQFVPLRDRQAVLDRVFAALNPGGALVLFEKVRAPDARLQDIATALYTDYKLAQGYSGEEILAKSRSLKGVLEPCTREDNLAMLERAGFTSVMTVFRYVCFEGLVAVGSPR